MNVIYARMNSPSEVIPLPVELELENKGCALFEIQGKVFPCVTQPLFLCVDFVRESIVGEKMMPILRRVMTQPLEETDQCSAVQEAHVDRVFDKMLWLACTRSPVKEFRLYISDAQGNRAPFLRCQLDCTLVILPHLQ